MPIKGLTDRGLAFPEIGQIRKGAKKTESKPGADLTYFRVEFGDGPADQESARVFLATYGPQPREIRIILPFDEIDRMWDAWLEGYVAGRMVARADGDKYQYLVSSDGSLVVKNGVDVKTNMERPYIDGQPCYWYTNTRGERVPVYCKPSGRLKVIIPELARAAYLTVLTTSIHDIGNISQQLEAFRQLNNGRIAGIPLVLRRRPKAISTPNPNDPTVRVRRVKWLLSIEADPEWVKLALSHAKKLALPGNGLPLLHEPDPEGESEFDQDDFEYDYNQDQTTPAEYEPESQAPASEEPESQAEPEPKVDDDLTEAQEMTSTDGKRYGDLDSKTLYLMRSSIQGALERGSIKVNGAMRELTDEERNLRDKKLWAINTILISRGEKIS